MSRDKKRDRKRIILDRVANRLNEIGLTARVNEEANGFIGQVDIVKGELEYRTSAKAADLLHEAGHLACLPPELRQRANTDLSDALDMAEDEIEIRMAQSGNPDDPYIRAIMQCSDGEATAWAWAMGVSLGLEPEEILEDGDYDGEVESIRLGLSLNSYLGINGLRAAGMVKSVKDYPVLTKWLQDAE